MEYLFVAGPLDGKVARVAPEVQVVTGPWIGSYVRSPLSERTAVFHYKEPIVEPDPWAKRKRVGGFPKARTTR